MNLKIRAVTWLSSSSSSWVMWPSVVDDVGDVGGVAVDDDEHGRDGASLVFVIVLTLASTLSWATLRRRRSALIVVGFPMPALCSPRRLWDFLRWRGSANVVIGARVARHVAVGLRRWGWG